MSHFDSITRAPEGFEVTATTSADARSPRSRIAAAVSTVCSSIPRCSTPPTDSDILKHFLYEACGCRPTWTMTSIIETQVDAIREQVGKGRAICGLSGGVDSAVAAALVHKAIGPQLTCVFVDTGLHARRARVNRWSRPSGAAKGSS